MFYATPEIFAVKILCRISPGHALLDLLFRLHRRKTGLRYHGSEGYISEEVLCTESALSACRRDKPFVREIHLQALSPDTLIDVQLTMPTRHYISRCPYRLGNLIRDQGINCFFTGAKESQNALRARGKYPMRNANFEAQKLVDCL